MGTQEQFIQCKCHGISISEGPAQSSSEKEQEPSLIGPDCTQSLAKEFGLQVCGHGGPCWAVNRWTGAK